MKKTCMLKRLLSFALCLCMVLSLVPLSSLTAFAADDVKYLHTSEVDKMLARTPSGSYINSTPAEAVTIEAGIENPEYTRFYFEGSNDKATGYWYAGATPGTKVENDFSDKTITLNDVACVYMTGGNVGYLSMRDSLWRLSHNYAEVNISGGYIESLFGLWYSSASSVTVDIDINFTVKDAALGTICCAASDKDIGSATLIFNGDISIDVANATVNDIYDTKFNKSIHNGDTYICVLDSTVKNIYVNAKSKGEHSGYINSGKLSNTDCFTNLVYLNGESWMLKGDMNAAMRGKDLVIGEGQTMTLNNGQTCDSKIINHGTLTVKSGMTLNNVINYGTMVLESGSAVTRLENKGTLNSTGVLMVGNLENDGVVNFTGTAHSTTVVNNRTNNAKFYCHGDHDGMNVIQESGWFYCDNPDCETKLKGRYYGVVPLEWKLYYADVTNEKGVPCYTQEYSCTLVPQKGMLLSPNIRVSEFANYTQTLVEGVDYSYDRTTGEFKLFRHAVTFYPISITTYAYDPTDISKTEVTLDQNRFLFDGTAKEPKVVSVTYEDHVLEEGKDYVLVEYRYNVDPGTGYVLLEGLGEYRNIIYVPFEIYQLDLADKGRITVEEGNWKFTNQEITPQITVYHGDTVLVEGQDYTVSYENNINPGTGTVKVTGMGQYKGTLTEMFTISKASIKDVTITGQEMPYNGEKQSLNIQVTFNGMTLKEGVDYTLRNTGSTQLQYVGDVTNIDIQGIGDRFQGYSEFRWTIVDAPLSDFTFARIDKDGKELVYNGFPQTPPSDWYVVVKNSQGKELYIVGNWTPVTNVGDISTFTPSKSTSFTGSIQVPGIITPASLYDVTAYDNFKNRTYTGQSQQVNLRAYMMTKDGQVYELVEGEDYTVSGTTEATEPGTYSLTLIAKGKNFTDSRTVTWSINPVDISQLEITHGAVPAFTYNGNPQTPDTKVYYTYPDGTKVEVPGSWSSVTNVGDDTTFTADSEYFTGSVTVEDLVQPLDITNLLEMEQTGVYHGSKQEPIFRLTGYDSFTYQMSWDRDPIDIGTYTATFTGTKNFTGTVTRTYEVTPRELSITVRLENKFYDGTNDVEVKNVTLEGVMEGDDVALDATDLVITLPSADAGDYPTAAASGLTLTGEALKNYTYDLNTVALQGEYGGTFDIAKRDVLIIAEEQYLTEGEELDPTMWYVDEGFLPPEGFTVSDVVLTANEDGEIIPSGGIVTNAAGEDVTKNFNLRYYSSSLNLVCTNHVCDEDGFCDNCGGYEMPDTDPGEDPEWEYDDIYLVYNAGQLFWVTDYVNNVHNEINVKLMADITVPEGKQWTPIMNFYGTFDGNYKTVSGLHVKSERDEIGFFGGGSYSYGTIKNLGLRNSSFEGASSVGGIAGHHYGTIENCFVDGTVTVTGNRSVGALVGDLSGTVLNCYAYAPVLAGYSNYGYIENGYYLSDTETEDGGKTAEQFASGEVAYLLQSAIAGEDIWDEETDEWIGTAEPKQVWGQTIGKDVSPVLGGQKVNYGYITCADDAQPEYTNNENPPAEKPDHSYNTTTAICSVCSKQAEALAIIGETATAYEQLSDAIAAVADCTAEDKAVVKLCTSVSMGDDAQVIEGGVFTLDLNGHKLSGTNLGAGVLQINGGEVTVIGGELEGFAEGALEGVTGIVLTRGQNHTKITLRDVKVTMISQKLKPAFAVVAQNTDMILENVIIDSPCYAIAAGGSNLEIIGGSISSAVMDLYCMKSTIILREGVTFVDGIDILAEQLYEMACPLNSMLGEGMAYWQNGAMQLLPDDAILLPGGDVTVKAACTHENSTISYVPTEDGTQHFASYSCCGMAVVGDHTFIADGLCICGTACIHSTHNPNGICPQCTMKVEHIYDDQGVCQRCEAYQRPILNGDTYLIYTAQQLYWFAAQVNSGNSSINGKLMNNIVVNEGTMTAETVDAQVWTPMGKSKESPYSGTFDGQGYTISGLYFNDSDADFVGLFGVVNTGTVKNVGVINSWFHGNRCVGGLAGATVLGTVINCYNTGHVSGKNDVGGVVGYNGGDILECYNTGDISGSGSNIGGIAGINYFGISNCYNVGTVTGNSSSGGLTVNDEYAYDADPVVTNSYYLDSCGAAGVGTAKTVEQFASGEVAYLLGKAYGQKIGTDPYPILGEPKVYYVTGCDGASVYSNTNISGHAWINETCTEPKTCSVCGETEGTALGHSWNDATCTEPKTCSVCGETEGTALGHDWNDATCTDPKTCSVCGETEGTALGHNWNDATCTDPKTCSVCGETEGDALGHSYEAVFNWSVNHESCEVILTCAHQCGQQITLAAQVTNDTSDPTCTVHTAAVQYEGKDYRDVLDCDIHRTAFDISGHITSFGAADGEVTVRLMQGDTEIASVVSVDGTYRFETIPLGEYTLTVSKLNHVTRTYPLTVSDGTVDQDVKIHLIGDIDGNGKVDVTDMAKLYAHIRKTTAITDAYQLQCANVKSGNLNITDVAALYSHIKGIHKLY